MTRLSEHNLVVCAWRLDTKISAEKYVDALDKLIYLAKDEVANKIMAGISNMALQGHTLPRRNIHYMIGLIMEKEFDILIPKEVKKNG